MKPCDMLLRSQTRIDLLFTMSEIPHARPEGRNVRSDVFADDDLDETLRRSSIPSGGARRDRTDDLMLAKHALSQLSYGPVPEDECFTLMPVFAQEGYAGHASLRPAWLRHA
jgi:hypothetical protein